MTGFEVAYLAAEPFVLPLHREVRRRLKRILQRHSGTADVLDVGGRQSHYTTAVPARVTITDLRRETATQRALHLGLSDDLIARTRRRRSNIEDIVIDDITRSVLPGAAFDCVVAVEVLEHVDEDARFLSQVHRVLRPGGTFLMTTPNGDDVPVENSDHKRHYQRAELGQLLGRWFEHVDIHYAIVGGPFRRLGLRSWSLRRPLSTATAMLANVVNGLQSSRPSVSLQSRGTRHLVAVASKQV